MPSWGRWISPRAGRRDGVPLTTIGPWDALEILPIRDFGLLQPQPDRAVAQFEPYPTIMVLSTDGDTRPHWVSAGQALQRVLLTATWLNLSTTPISQPVEIPAIRELLTDTRGGRWAQLVIRVGYGPPATATPRRPLAEVLLPDQEAGFSAAGESAHVVDDFGQRVVVADGGEPVP